MEPNTVFHKPHSGAVSFNEVMNDIVSFVKVSPEHFYKVIIGSDSSSSNPVSVITAILVWRVGKGGIYFLHKNKPAIYHTNRDRIIAETLASITLAQEVRSYLSLKLDGFLWDGNEIHADVGENGETKAYIREVTGLIKGVDFVPVIKPYSWCASSVADRHT